MGEEQEQQKAKDEAEEEEQRDWSILEMISLLTCSMSPFRPKGRREKEEEEQQGGSGRKWNISLFKVNVSPPPKMHGHSPQRPSLKQTNLESKQRQDTTRRSIVLISGNQHQRK